MPSLDQLNLAVIRLSSVSESNATNCFALSDHVRHVESETIFILIWDPAN